MNQVAPFGLFLFCEHEANQQIYKLVNQGILDSQIAFISADGAIGRTFKPIGQTMMTETVLAIPRDSLI